MSRERHIVHTMCVLCVCWLPSAGWGGIKLATNQKDKTFISALFSLLVVDLFLFQFFEFLRSFLVFGYFVIFSAEPVWISLCIYLYIGPPLYSSIHLCVVVVVVFIRIFALLCGRADIYLRWDKFSTGPSTHGASLLRTDDRLFCFCCSLLLLWLDQDEEEAK